MVDVAGPQRPAFRDLGQEPGPQPRIVAVDLAITVAGAHPGPAELEQRMILDRHQGSLVSPALRQDGRIPGQGIEPGPVVEATPGEHRQVVAAFEDVHRVQLQHPQAAHHLLDARPTERRPAGVP